MCVCVCSRVVDPQGQHGGRRRTASAGSRDHHLGSLAEDPTEQDQLHDSDSETATTGRLSSRVRAGKKVQRVKKYTDILVI